MTRLLRTSLFFRCLIAFGATAQAQIDFTPTVEPYTSEGAVYSTVRFKDGGRAVSFTLPRLWSCRGDASRLQLSPPDQNFAEGVIQAASGKPPARFDDAAIKALSQQVLGSLPMAGQGAAIISQQENPVLLNGYASYELVVSYQNLGQTFLRSVIYVNCPEQQLVFRFSAPKDAFAKLNASFRQSLYSWEWKELALPAAAQALAATK